jgi:tRNA synthetase class II (G, H, P, S and T)/anticodon tRNA-binding protein
MKPMNCPGHCLIFASKERSYRELPLRMAEFGVLHRNEASGALSGLTRVRRFIQDDSHIFCREDQIGPEISGLFDFLEVVYGKLGMKFKLKLSTRPEKFLGEVATWDRAEATLQESLQEFARSHGAEWELNPGDGAFYGPKIDITIMDALHRWHQCATIQLDFQLPNQFNLSYMAATSSGDAAAAAEKAAPKEAPAVEAKESKPEEPKTEAKTEAKADGKSDVVKAPAAAPAAGHARPVMVHRAVLGSFERFIAILTEHFAGKWPLWLSPRQVMIVPVMTTAEPYCKEVEDLLRARHFHVDSDFGSNTMNKKIRNAQMLQYNFIFGKKPLAGDKMPQVADTMQSSAPRRWRTAPSASASATARATSSASAWTTPWRNSSASSTTGVWRTSSSKGGAVGHEKGLACRRWEGVVMHCETDDMYACMRRHVRMKQSSTVAMMNIRHIFVHREKSGSSWTPAESLPLNPSTSARLPQHCGEAWHDLA